MNVQMENLSLNRFIAYFETQYSCVHCMCIIMYAAVKIYHKLFLAKQNLYLLFNATLATRSKV